MWTEVMFISSCLEFIRHVAAVSSLAHWALRMAGPTRSLDYQSNTRYEATQLLGKMHLDWDPSCHGATSQGPWWQYRHKKRTHQPLLITWKHQTQKLSRSDTATLPLLKCPETIHLPPADQPARCIWRAVEILPYFQRYDFNRTFANPKFSQYSAL